MHSSLLSNSFTVCERGQKWIKSCNSVSGPRCSSPLCSLWHILISVHCCDFRDDTLLVSITPLKASRYQAKTNPIISCLGWPKAWYWDTLFYRINTSWGLAIQSHDILFHFYADDTQLYVSFWPEDPKLPFSLIHERHLQLNLPLTDLVIIWKVASNFDVIINDHSFQFYHQCLCLMF